MLIVQRNIFTPKANPVIPEVGELGELIVPVPETNVQFPVPTVGVFPARVAVVAQTIWSAPAWALLGVLVLVMVILSILEEELTQGELEMVQRKTFAPTPNPVTPELAALAELIVPVPETNVQFPVPTVGVFPSRVAVVAQTIWSAPVLAMLGVSVLVMVILSILEEELTQGELEIVQLNTFAPTPNPVTPEVGELEVVIVPAPETSVQAPVPTDGVLPARVAVVAHTV